MTDWETVMKISILIMAAAFTITSLLYFAYKNDKENTA